MRITGHIVDRPGTLIAGGSDNTDPTGEYDILIDSIPFMAAYSPDGPFRRGTAPYRKDQQDQTTEPGEQSLVTWWLRSQGSFHAGAGRIFEEPQEQSDTTATIRFDTSYNIDPWTPGKVTLQPDLVTVAPTASGSSGCQTFRTSGQDAVLYWPVASSSNIGTAINATGDTWSTSTIAYGGSGGVLSVASDGSNYYVASNDHIYSGALPSGAGSALWNYAGTTTKVAIGWCKQRLMAGIDNKIYELAGTPGALPAANFIHPNPNWQWVGFAEDATTIFAAGYAGHESAVYAFDLNTSGAVPTLGTGTTAVQMPAGEVITAIGGYLNGYVLLGTNRGVRVCAINTGGHVILGALSVDFSQNGRGTAVTALAGRKQYVYAAVTGGLPGSDPSTNVSGLVRIDLGTIIDGVARYAWAPDLPAPDGATTGGVCLVGNRMAFTTNAGQLYAASQVNQAVNGWLTTGRIRYHTLEPKLFKYLQMRVLPLSGQVQAQLLDAYGNTSTLPIQGTPGQSLLDTQPTGLPAQEYIQVRMNLYRDGTSLQGPTLIGYQLKSLPAQKRQRLETFVVNLYDHEDDRNGLTVGRDGWAVNRLQRLEAIEEAGDAVVIKHLTADPEGRLSRLSVIDEMEFVQTVTPSNRNGWGGRLRIVTRSIT